MWWISVSSLSPCLSFESHPYCRKKLTVVFVNSPSCPYSDKKFFSSSSITFVYGGRKLYNNECVMKKLELIVVSKTRIINFYFSFLFDTYWNILSNYAPPTNIGRMKSRVIQLTTEIKLYNFIFFPLSICRIRLIDTWHISFCWVLLRSI